METQTDSTTYLVHANQQTDDKDTHTDSFDGHKTVVRYFVVSRTELIRNL